MVFHFSFWAVAKLCSKRKAVSAPHYIAILCVKQGHFLRSGTELLAVKKVIIIQVSHLLLATGCMNAVSSGYGGIFSCTGKDGGAEISEKSRCLILPPFFPTQPSTFSLCHGVSWITFKTELEKSSSVIALIYEYVTASYGYVTAGL